MIVLGINAFRADSSAVILRDGQLIAAVEEERFRRSKHWAGFPSMSIRYCLEAAGIGISKVNHVAVNQDTTANLGKHISSRLKHRPDLDQILDRIRNNGDHADTLELLAHEFPGEPIQARLHFVEHHAAHLASAFLCSPHEAATVVSVDGFGDFASTAWGQGHGREIVVEGRVYFPHSLGIFYQAMTQFLGFPRYCAESNVMGLASFGQPKYMEEMRQIVLLQEDGSFRLNMDYFTHDRNQIEHRWEGGHPNIGPLYSPALIELLGASRTPEIPVKGRHKDIAHSVQAMYQEAFFHLLRHLHNRHGLDAVAIAGSCGINSVANGRVRANSPFEKIYIQAAAGDAGGALGAACTVYHDMADGSRQTMTHAQWGPEFSNSDYQALFVLKKSQLEQAGCHIERIDDEQALCERTVDCILDGAVVGWFQGRMEWGPRALGNRCILCDPRRGDLKDILNFKIKRCESFRSFAASVLREYVSEWFEEDDDVPFMMKAIPIRAERRAEIPAVTHVDGTGRLQTVHQDSNPLFWKLIETFRQKTGVPMLLNTSFNENEPIVCMPDEALDCFLRTNMDLLVMGKWIINRSSD